MCCLLTPSKSADNRFPRARSAVCLRDAVAPETIQIHVVFSVRERKRIKMASSPRKQKNTSPDGSECTQLLQLLAKNPSAALKVFKLTSPSDEKPSGLQSYKGRRPKVTIRNSCDSRFQFSPQAQFAKVRFYCLPPKCDSSRMQKQKKPSNANLLTKEELELKSKCVDDLGYFNFDAILPAVYWKCESDLDCTDVTNRQGTES